MSIFNGRDANQDGKLTAEELEGSPMAARFGQLDKDGDKAVSAEEFRSGISTLFGGNRGGNRGGGGGGGGGRYRGGQDNRPERPQRPSSEG
jgi:outer membrane protein assembly factor BamB